jgi:hypothetical protein
MPFRTEWYHVKIRIMVGWSMRPSRGPKEHQADQSTQRLLFVGPSPCSKFLDNGRQELAPANDASPDQTRLVQSSVDCSIRRESASSTSQVCVVSLLSMSTFWFSNMYGPPKSCKTEMVSEDNAVLGVLSKTVRWRYSQKGVGETVHN